MKLGACKSMKEDAIKKLIDTASLSLSNNLYVLKHKDLDVAMVMIDEFSGKIDYILDVFLPEELPLGCHGDVQNVIDWWKSRAIPDSRRGIQQTLHYLGEQSNLTLMLSAYGLSLTDHYWMQPIAEEQYWKDLNFFENDFSDELGSILTDSDRVDIEGNISKFSPSSSVTGEMKKKWIIKDGIRYLMKVNANDYGQQAVNEVIATRLHERLGWKNYVSYEIEYAVIEGQNLPCSINPLFTSQELELVSGYQLVKDIKTPNDSSNYEELIHQSVKYGMEESEVRKQLEYTIMTDFILSNTDRHYNNFGFLYDPAQHQLVKMAPIFDTGNILFYNKEIIPKEERLLDITVSSFREKEIKLLEYVTDKNLVDTGLLDGFPKEVEKLLKEYTDMPEERAESIADTVRQKIEYLQLFQQGKKIWKRKQYW